MPDFIRMQDFTDVAGRTDWAAFHAAKMANGEECTRCHAFIVFNCGYPSLCNSCRSIDSDEKSVTHDSMLRCPKCRHRWNVHDSDSDLYGDGEHDIYCPKCDHEFTITTNVSFTFESPALEKQDEEENNEEDGEAAGDTAA